jgi:death-on-curing protein
MIVTYLSVSDVLEIHQHAIELSGGMEGVRDPGALEAAVMSPQATFGGVLLLPSLADVAAAYTFYLCKSHPFFDGNKRTSLFAAMTFLEMHGYEIEIPESWEDAIVQVANGELSREQLADLYASEMGDRGDFV